MAEYLRTLDLVEEMKGEIFVPSPRGSIFFRPGAGAGQPCPLSLLWRKRYRPFWKRLVLLKPFCSRSSGITELTMNFEQYVLIGSTVRSYLSWLKDQGKITAVFENNLLLWSRC